MKQYFVYIPGDDTEQGPFPAEMIRNAYEQGIYSDTVMLREVDSENRLSINTVFAKAQPAVVVGNTPSDKLKPPAISITQTQQASSTKNNRQLIIGGAVALIAAVIFAVCFGSGGGTITREEAVRELRQAGVIASELDIQGRIGSLAMMTACEQGNSTIVKLLLAGGITARQLNNEEVLKIATQNGHTEIVELLLTAPGISPNSGYPLEVAASHGHTEIVKLLLAAPDIRVNDGECLIIEKTNRWGSTSRSYISDNCGPLIKAVKYNHMEIVRLLLEAPGIEVNHKYRDGDFEYTPLSLAFCKGHVEIVKLLLAAPGIDANISIKTEYNYRSLLDIVAESGNVELIKNMLAVPGIDVNKGEALGTAAGKGHTDIVKLLLAAPNIDVNNTCGRDYEYTPLLKAAANGHSEIVKLLLAAPNIDVNKTCWRDYEGDYEYTPLLIAAENGHSEIVKLLLASPGIDVNKKCRQGFTEAEVRDSWSFFHKPPKYESPLSLASQKGHTKIVQLLRAAGARE